MHNALASLIIISCQLYDSSLLSGSCSHIEIRALLNLGEIGELVLEVGEHVLSWAICFLYIIAKPE